MSNVAEELTWATITMFNAVDYAIWGQISGEFFPIAEDSSENSGQFLMVFFFLDNFVGWDPTNVQAFFVPNNLSFCEVSDQGESPKLKITCQSLSSIIP